MYNYLIVGAGLFGAVFAHEATKKGKTCLVIDKHSHIGGNIYTENTEGISVHKYGAHIFHTSNKEVWNYVNQFAEFNNYINQPVAVYKDELYNLPFNYTRIIEHKHFEFQGGEKTIISKEFSEEWKPGVEPYYPINNDENNVLLAKYQKLAAKRADVIFGGRLGMYKYYDIYKVIEAALECVSRE